MKKVLLIVLLIMLASPVKALALTKTNRDQMITIAGPYTKVPWRVNKTNSKYPEFSTSGKQIYGMSYSFGDKVKIGTNSLGGTFLKEITSGLMPRNWAGSNWTPTKPVSETTGIDCSGFISWVWSLDSYRGTGTLGNNDIATPVGTSNSHPSGWDMKKGDIFNKSGSHVVLYVSGPDNVSGKYKIYEASGSRVQGIPNMVVRSNHIWELGSGYKPYRRKEINESMKDATPPIVSKVTPVHNSAVFMGQSYMLQAKVDELEADLNSNGRGDVSDMLQTAASPRLIRWETKDINKKIVRSGTKNDYWGIPVTNMNAANKDYRLSKMAFNISALAPGPYTVRVTSEDWHKNLSTKGYDVKLTRRQNFGRISDTNRYTTNKKITLSYSGWSKTGSKYVVLARSEYWYDVLPAAPLAKKLGAPILINEGGSGASLTATTKETLNELQKIKPIEKIYIIGGTGAISEKVENELKKTWKIQRISGSDAPKTAIEIAEQLSNPKTAFLVKYDNQDLPHGITAASAAALKNYSLLYTKSDQLPQSTKDYIKTKKLTKIFIIGGPDLVKDNVVNELKGLGCSVERIQGATRYTTAVEILNKFWGSDNKPKGVILTNGVNAPFVDSYGGLGYAAKFSYPLMIVPKEGELSWWKARENDLDSYPVAYMTLLGGPSATNYYYRRCSTETDYPSLALTVKDKVYTQPNKSSASIKTAYQDQRYIPVNYQEKFYDEENNLWFKIYFSGQEGWIFGDSVHDIIGERVIQVTSNTNVFDLPNYEYPKGSVLKNQYYAAPIDDSGWAGIYYDGTIAYVPPGSYKIAQLGPQDKKPPSIEVNAPSYVNRGEKTITVSVDEPLDENDGLVIEIKDSKNRPIDFTVVDNAVDGPPDEEEETMPPDEGSDEQPEDETPTDSYEIEVPEEEEGEDETAIEDGDEDAIDDQETEAEKINYLVKLVIDDGVAEGVATIKVRAKDEANNTSEKESEFIVDLSPPETKVLPQESLHENNGKSYSNSTNIFTIKPEDKYSGVDKLMVSINDGAYQAFPGAVNVNFKKEGLNKINYYAVDKAGNLENIKLFEVVIDASAPVSEISADLINSKNEIIPETQFTISSKDFGVDPSGLARIEYRVNNEDWINYSPFTLQTQKPGNYLIKYRAIDNVGNVEIEQTMKVIVKKALAIEVYDKTALRRTSVWLNLNEEQLNKVNRQALEDLLNRDSYIYNIADSRDAFIKDIQSNIYTSYLILGNQHNFTGQIGAQLREQIYAGKTVVSSLFSNVDEVTMPQTSSEFDEIFAVKNVGSFPGKSHTLTFDQTLEIKGRALKLEPAQSAFIYGRLNDTLYPAIIQNNFGLGKTYLLAFDAFENLHDSQVTSYLENLLYQASPSIQNLPYSPKVFEVKIRANVVPITAYFDINGSNALPLNPESYPYYFNAQTETQSIKLLVRYSDNEQAIFKVNSGYLVRGEPIASQTFAYVEKLEETSRSLISKSLIELDALIENDSNPKLQKARAYLEQLEEPRLENKETVVHELLKVIKDAVSYKQLREYLAKLTIIYGSFY